MPLVAGVDSSTQSCKVVIRDAVTGALVRHGRAAHPDGTEIDPQAWWLALHQAIAEAGGLDDVSAVSVAAQQHGMVVLDDSGEVIRPALLWNDTRSAPQATRLIAQCGGAAAWASAVGVVPVASFTVTKLAWLAEHEPDAAARVAAVCLPHDWLTWRLLGHPGPGGSVSGGSVSGGSVSGGRPSIEALTTDRGDASGTGYFSAETGRYRRDLLIAALGHDAVLPRVLAPAEAAGTTRAGRLHGADQLIAAGTGDNAASALGLSARPGDVIVSIGTSGVVCAVAEHPTRDETGTVAGFADATGRFLPLIATLNAARVLEATAQLLGVDLSELSQSALQAESGAGGLVLLPYLEGERTPNRPQATGSLFGLRLQTMTRRHLARAAVEGLLCGLADGLDAITAQGVRAQRVLLIGGGAQSEAVRRLAPAVLGLPVLVPPPGEYVADGAARQAAWALSGAAEPPQWSLGRNQPYEADPAPAVRARYAAVRDLS